MKYFVFILSLSIGVACNNLNVDFIEEEVSFSNNLDGTILSGTFTKPIELDAFPVVILISGAGQQDRDETVYGHKSFKVLAEFLSKNGFGVLRYDDRGIGGSKGAVWDATLEVQASDAYAGIQYLKARKDVETDKIGIIGHSLGAMQGTILASKYQDISFLIMLGGIWIPFIENHIKSDSLTNTLKGEPIEAVESGQRVLKELLNELKKTPPKQDYQITRLRLESIIRDWQSSLSGKAKAEIEQFIKSDPDFFYKEYCRRICNSSLYFLCKI